MAWNPSPEIVVARDAAKALGALASDQVTCVVILYTTAGGKLGRVSYPKDKRLCDYAKSWASALYENSLKFFSSSDE